MMSKQLTIALDALHHDVLSLAGRVEEAVDRAVTALKTHNRDLAQQVLDGDDQIDALENRVHRDCLSIFARHQPVASDLRRTAMVLMISSDLERMGDLATGVAEQMLSMPEWALDAAPGGLPEMGDLTAISVHEAVEAFVRQDAETARRVIVSDARINEHNDQIIGEVTERMKESPEWVEPGLALYAMTRHLERIADHATNVAEDVIFLVDGEVMRHHFPGSHE